MKNTVVIGAQWGDEGKAKITDLLAQKADLIIRYQGGCVDIHPCVDSPGFAAGILDQVSLQQYHPAVPVFMSPQHSLALV